MATYLPSQQPIDPFERGFQTIFPGTSQKLAIGAGAVESAEFALNRGRNNIIVRLFPTQDCWVVFGVSPVAAPNDGASFFCPGGIVQWMAANPGATKLSVIQDTTSGFLHIVEGA